MKKANNFKWIGFALIIVAVAGVLAFVFVNKASSSRIVLADEAKEHAVMLHDAAGEHACDCYQPIISNVTLSNITSTSVDVSWKCGVASGYTGTGASTYQVTYGTTATKSSIYPTTRPTVTYSDHTVTVPGLNPNTLYHIGVKSYCLVDCQRGGGPNLAKTFQQSPKVDDWTFTTSPVGATYTISGSVKTGAGAGIAAVTVALSGTASKTAITAADGTYSLTGVATGNYTITPAKTGFTFSPANKSFANLNANQTAQNFTGTPATGVLTETGAIAIKEYAVAKVTAKDVTITWKTNIPSTSQVEYGLTREYGMSSGINTEMVFNHDIQLFELMEGKTYHARAVSFDSANGLVLRSPDFTFKTPAFEDRIVDKSIFIEPNPASTWAMFSYVLYQPARSVTITIHSLSGKQVATLESPSSSLNEGWNKVRWDNISLPNGLYVYKMTVRTATNQEEQIQYPGLRIQR